MATIRWTQAQNIPMVVISPRLVKLAHQQGFKTVLSSASISKRYMQYLAQSVAYIR